MAAGETKELEKKRLEENRFLSSPIDLPMMPTVFKQLFYATLGGHPRCLILRKPPSLQEFRHMPIGPMIILQVLSQGNAQYAYLGGIASFFIVWPASSPQSRKRVTSNWPQHEVLT